MLYVVVNLDQSGCMRIGLLLAVCWNKEWLGRNWNMPVFVWLRSERFCHLNSHTLGALCKEPPAKEEPNCWLRIGRCHGWSEVTKRWVVHFFDGCTGATGCNQQPAIPSRQGLPSSGLTWWDCIRSQNAFMSLYDKSNEETSWLGEIYIRDIVQGISVDIIVCHLTKIIYNCNMIWYDMIWYDMIWYDMIWYDMI